MRYVSAAVTVVQSVKLLLMYT